MLIKKHGVLLFIISLGLALPVMAGKNNIALGKSYTWSKPPNAFPNGYDGRSMCKDDGDATQLTDGKLADRCWWDKRTVGWWFEGNMTITIDLGEEMPIDEVALHLSSEKVGMRVPRRLTVFVSNDNKKFLPVAEILKNRLMNQWREKMVIGKQDGNPHAWLKINDIKSKGRYVLLKFDSVNLYLDEIEIFPGALKKDEITLPQSGWMTPPLDLYPFYKRNKAYFASNALLPIHLKSPDGKWNAGIDIYLDLPEGIRCVSPKSIAPLEEIKIGRDNYTRYTFGNVQKLFLTGSEKNDSKAKMRITARKTHLAKAGRSQLIYLESVKIPEVKPFKKLIANVGFVSFSYYKTWPDAVDNYKKVGLNLFTPFGHMDYYFNFLLKQHAPAIKMIAEAKSKGLIVGANFSPFCNGAINEMAKKFKGGKAVYLTGGTDDTACPRCYLNNLGKSKKDQLAQIIAGAKYGIDFFIFDSEPHWTGRICACPNCEKEWKRFLSRKAPDLPYMSSSRTYTSKSPVYLPLYQQFWNGFHVKLWKKYRDGLERMAKKHEVTLGLYGCPREPTQASGTAYVYANKPLFNALFNNDIIDYANPSMYLVPTEELGDKIRELRDNLPPRAPMYVWVTAGSRGVNFERSSADVRNRLLELFFNGAQGFFFWNAYGVDAKDYQTIAEVVKELRPFEQFFINGVSFPSKWVKAPDGVRVIGKIMGREAVVLVSRYGKKNSKKVIIKINAPAEALSPRIAESMSDGKKPPLKDGTFEVDFSGKEYDYCKIFYLHP